VNGTGTRIGTDTKGRREKKKEEEEEETDTSYKILIT
jgi:hypothetical protein